MFDIFDARECSCILHDIAIAQRDCLDALGIAAREANIGSLDADDLTVLTCDDQIVIVSNAFDEHGGTNLVCNVQVADTLATTAGHTVRTRFRTLAITLFGDGQNLVTGLEPQERNDFVAFGERNALHTVRATAHSAEAANRERDGLTVLSRNHQKILRNRAVGEFFSIARFFFRSIGW